MGTAPSLADIVREQTQGGRLIVRFLVNAMTADTTSFKPCHRVDATAQLIKLQAHDSPFAHIVHEMTDGGNLITQFLIQAITGQLADFQDCHNMAAQRLLAKLYPEMARVLAEDDTPSPSLGVRSAAFSAVCDVPGHEDAHTGAVGAAPSLDEIARQETNDGREMVRFYADVMRGVLTDFKTHQRMDAADKLVSLCSEPAPVTPAARHTGSAGILPAPDPVPETAWKWKPEWTHFEYPEDRTYDFSSYDEDDYDRDVFGDKALVHIFRDDETKDAANLAVLDYKVDLIEAQRAAVNSKHDTCQPADPPDCPVPRHGSLPRTRYGDTFGPHVYGYNALVFIYDSKAAARAGYVAAMDHKEKQRLALLAADGYNHLDDIGDNGPDPPERPPPEPKPRMLVHFGPPYGYD